MIPLVKADRGRRKESKRIQRNPDDARSIAGFLCVCAPLKTDRSNAEKKEAGERCLKYMERRYVCRAGIRDS